jgi:DNA anti-recombination protein RmuC
MTTISNELSAVATATPGGPVSGDRQTAAEAGGASIDKVRDILFGNQVREFERRFVRLDERLAKEISDMKAEMKSRLDALELYTKKEVESLVDQIKAEHADRLDANASLSRELGETAKSLERRALTIDEQHSKGQRELRQQMLEQDHRLTDEIRKRGEEIFAALAREAQELRSDKADRATLASLLTEMALRLTNDFHLPDVEDAKNG